MLLLEAMLCGCAWGKALVIEGKEPDLELLETGNAVEAPKKGPCVYRGNIFTADVAKIASRFK
jgi:hypothetical protein